MIFDGQAINNNLLKFERLAPLQSSRPPGIRRFGAKKGKPLLKGAFAG
jgi:hypothetical protein